MKQFGRFILSMAKVGCIGFGGGSALIPVVEDEIIKQQKLDTKKNYDKDVIVASITPGALPVEIAASLGKRNFGWKGMFMGALMMALPGAFVTVLLLTILSTVQSGMLTQIEIASVGVSAFIMFLLTSYIINVMKSCKKESNARFGKAIFVMLAVCALACGKNLFQLLGISATPIFSVSTFHILVAAFFCILYTGGQYNIKNVSITVILCVIYLLSYGKAKWIDNIYVTRVTEGIMLILAVWGIIKGIRNTNKETKVDTKAIYKDAGVWIVIFILFSLPAVLCSMKAVPFLANGLLSAIMSFGGGDAYLTVADGLFVASGMITEQQFYSQIVSIVNILPGSILCKTLAGVGYYVGYNATGQVAVGITFAVAGFICSIAASCGFFAIIYYLYDSLTSLHVFRMISRWSGPIISGLLINIMLSLCNQSMAVAENLQKANWQVLGTTLGLYIVILLLGRKTKVKHIFLLLLGVIVPFLLF